MPHHKDCIVSGDCCRSGKLDGSPIEGYGYFYFPRQFYIYFYQFEPYIISVPHCMEMCEHNETKKHIWGLLSDNTETICKKGFDVPNTGNDKVYFPCYEAGFWTHYYFVKYSDLLNIRAIISISEDIEVLKKVCKGVDEKTVLYLYSEAENLKRKTIHALHEQGFIENNSMLTFGRAIEDKDKFIINLNDIFTKRILKMSA